MNAATRHPTIAATTVPALDLPDELESGDALAVDEAVLEALLVGVVVAEGAFVTDAGELLSRQDESSDKFT